MLTAYCRHDYMLLECSALNNLASILSLNLLSPGYLGKLFMYKAKHRTCTPQISLSSSYSEAGVAFLQSAVLPSLLWLISLHFYLF